MSPNEQDVSVPFEGSRLLRGLTACYLRRAGRHTDAELQCFDLLIALVLAKVEPLARAELSEQLADHTRPPRRVLLRLARDEIRIAAPILIRSPALSDADLERLATHQPQSHLAVIATRRPLAERVTDVLVARGDGAVLDQVIRNLEARLSERSFARLSERAETAGAFLDLLMARPDLPEEIAARLDPFIREALDGAIATLAAPVDGPTLDDLVRGSRLALASRLRAATARPREMLCDLLARGLLVFDDAVNELADAGRTFDVARLIASRLDLAPETALRVLCVSSEEAMAVLCRAAGLGVNGYSSVLRMRRRRQRPGARDAPTSPPAEALAAFLRIECDTARRAIALFRRRAARKADGAPAGAPL